MKIAVRKIKKYLRSKLYSIYQNNDFIYFYYRKYIWGKCKKEMIINDFDFVKKIYLKKTGNNLDLISPKTFDEKMQFLKLSNRDPLLTKCTDKYLVREYVKDCGLSHILNELYSVYNDAREINFDTLQSPCIIKVNNTSGCNIIFNKDKPFNKKSFIRRFNGALKHNHYIESREWNYKNIKPKIICERLLVGTKEDRLEDINFYCFSGEPELIFFNYGLSDESGFRVQGERFAVDKFFNIINLKTIMKPYSGVITKPKNFNKMLDYARTLSKPFPFVRVDLYNIKDKVYFGEMTFYPAGGRLYFEPTDLLEKFAKLTDISGFIIAPDALSTDKNE